MKDFLIENAGAIGGGMGLVIMITLLLTSKYWIETKWSYPVVASLLILGAFKFVGVCESIAKFIAK